MILELFLSYWINSNYSKGTMFKINHIVGTTEHMVSVHLNVTIFALYPKSQNLIPVKILSVKKLS